MVSGQRSQHGRHDVDRAVDGANSFGAGLPETDQRDLRWVDHPEDRVSPLVTGNLVMVIVRSDSSEPGPVPKSPRLWSDVGSMAAWGSTQLAGARTRIYARVLGPYRSVTATALAHARRRGHC